MDRRGHGLCLDVAHGSGRHRLERLLHCRGQAIAGSHVLGVQLPALVVHGSSHPREVGRDSFDERHAGLDNGTLRPVIGRELPMSEVVKAHQAVMEPGAFGKIVMIP